MPNFEHFSAMQAVIARRKSIRAYDSATLDDAVVAEIMAFAAGLTPLYPGIKTYHHMVPAGDIKNIQPWRAPHYLIIYSEDKEGSLENIGFMYQQLDLYLQSRGLGCCWVGLGKYDPKNDPAGADGLEFVIMLAIGRPAEGEGLRQGPDEFKRNAMDEISDATDPRLEAARLAPSAVNSQPWYFTHDGGVIHAHCRRRKLLKTLSLGRMNRIDMGIALCHLYVTNPDSFCFFVSDPAPQGPDGYYYLGSFSL